MMQRIILFIIVINFSLCGLSQDINARQNVVDSITKIEMNLNAFGVESDDFPSIQAFIDFRNDSSKCKRSYYNPAVKPSTYELSDKEIKKIIALWKHSDLKKLKREYTTPKTDQPTSTTIIYVGQQKFIIKDYGLVGDPPLQELYKIIYKL